MFPMLMFLYHELLLLDPKNIILFCVLCSIMIVRVASFFILGWWVSLEDDLWVGVRGLLTFFYSLNINYIIGLWNSILLYDLLYLEYGRMYLDLHTFIYKVVSLINTNISFFPNFSLISIITIKRPHRPIVLKEPISIPILVYFRKQYFTLNN